MKPGCQPYADAVVDEGAPRPGGLAQHLAACPSCRSLRSGHRGAQLLLGSQLPSPAQVPAAPVVRRAAALGVVLLAAAGFLLTREPALPVAAAPEQAQPATLEQPREEAPEASPVSHPELALQPPPPLRQPVETDDQRPLVELALLSRTVSRYARTNPVAHGYGPQWKSLPVLLAPSRSLHPATLSPEQ